MSSEKKQVRENFRNEVFKRDNNRCKICGAKGHLDAHHIINREQMPNGGYVKENGISLCESCHLKAEIYHSSGEKIEGWTPTDPYREINSSYQEALKASQK